jgi:pyruvate dehydrogenase kinase 2/3/4
MSWKRTGRLMDQIQHYANFPATGVSLRQMVQFGEKPSVGTDACPCRFGFSRETDH